MHEVTLREELAIVMVVARLVTVLFQGLKQRPPNTTST